MEAVVEVDVCGAGVDVEEEEGRVGVEFLEAVFDAFGHDVVGDAPERLHADDAVASPPPPSCLERAPGL